MKKIVFGRFMAVSALAERSPAPAMLTHRDADHGMQMRERYCDKRHGGIAKR